MSYEQRRPLRPRVPNTVANELANIAANELWHKRKSCKRNVTLFLSLISQLGTRNLHVYVSHLIINLFRSYFPAPAQKPVRTLNKQKGTASLQGLQKPLVTKNEAAPPKPVRQLRKRSKSNGEAMDVDSLPQVKPSKSTSLLTSDTLGCQGHN